MPHFLQNVLDALAKYSTRPLIKVLSGTFEGKPTWKTISYGQFLADIEKVAGYWLTKLEPSGIKPKDVIGTWVTGQEYYDLVTFYGLSRAGYVPQMLNKDMGSMASGGGSAVVLSVLSITGGKAILFDEYFKEDLKDFALPSFEIPSLKSLPAPAELPGLPSVEPDDVGVIFHTSGTTSGRPKPVPETHRWLICQAIVGWPQMYQAKEPAIMNNIGSFSNVGSATAISYLSCNGQCLVQTSRPDFDEVEFMAMVEEGLNYVLLYAPWLSKLITIAKSNKEVYGALKKMTQVTYTGASLNPEDEQWLIKNGIPVTIMYATTESAVSFSSLVTETDHLPSMRPFKGVGCTLIPLHMKNAEELDNLHEKRATGGQLYDLFIPAEADNCPHPSIRNRPDGHITGDVFEETGPGFYAFRGRSDDWIRTGRYLSFCDTKSLEDNILREASDLVKNCVVVGHYKTGVVLLAEPSNQKVEDEEILKSQILERHAAFNSKLFFHEKLNSTMQVVLVPQGSLPRTKEKGNIRRKAAEEENAVVLEQIYAKLKTW